jgi:hypothetical protein
VEQADRSGPTVLIRFDGPGRQLTGSIRVDESPERSFSGWLELLRELEGARPSAASYPREESS